MSFHSHNNSVICPGIEAFYIQHWNSWTADDSKLVFDLTHQILGKRCQTAYVDEQIPTKNHGFQLRLWVFDNILWILIKKVLKVHHFIFLHLSISLSSALSMFVILTFTENDNHPVVLQHYALSFLQERSSINLFGQLID